MTTLTRTTEACSCGSTTSCVAVTFADDTCPFTATSIVCQGCFTKTLVPRTFARSRFHDERPES